MEVRQQVKVRMHLTPSGVGVYDGEFDPGSERTLAARFKHASRTVEVLRDFESGERVSNT